MRVISWYLIEAFICSSYAFMKGTQAHTKSTNIMSKSIKIRCNGAKNLIVSVGL